MKTTVILSCLLAGSSMILNTHNLIATSTTTKVAKTGATKRTSYKTMPVAPVRIVIDKSSYELYVYDKLGWFATYPVVFGNNTLDDKKMEGDRNTPYMGLDYPTKESLAKFNERKRRGEIPSSASPGGGVGIHGTWPHEDFVIDRYKNWTNGCISLKNEDVEDLYSYIPVGTVVSIRK
jgi:lipoprotein-anchoring transpeptidase ErfK/SrfK